MTSYEERIENVKENKHIYNESKQVFRQMKNLPQDQRAKMFSGNRSIRDKNRNIRETKMDGKPMINCSTSIKKYTQQCAES